MTLLKHTLLGISALMIFAGSWLYPIDGYQITGIERLLLLQRIISGDVNGTKPPPGALKSIKEIKLNLADTSGNHLAAIPEPDADLQKSLAALFSGLNKNYSVALLEITPGREARYAHLRETQGYQPGSVGKLAVLAALFTELNTIYPDSFEKRQELLRTKNVQGGQWVISDSHTVPIYHTETGKSEKRVVQAGDVFSLYEWTDHMLSVSNNGAASVVWREALLMHVFGKDYLQLTDEQANQYFAKTPKKELSALAVSLVNEPLRQMGIESDEWRLGKLFTAGASQIIPAEGGSIGTPLGLMKYMVAMERGHIVDEKSSLEMKRLMYMTDRRIRYAASPAFMDAAVYFKSGSLYKCQQEEGFTCGKYMGNVYNYMNSVAIIEQPDGRTYMVCLMSNVLRKNSSTDHFTLASSIDKLIR